MSPRMPRVLVLNYEFPPMGGGAGHASYHIARTLAESGCDVDVITSGTNGHTIFEVHSGLRIFRVKSNRRSLHECGMEGAWAYVAAARPIFQRLLNAEQYDVIHYFFGLPTGFLSLLSPRSRTIPSVISLRGSDVPGYDASNNGLQWVHRAMLPVTKRIWKKASALVALSDSLRDLAQPILPEKTIGVIPNGIDVDHFHPNGYHATEHAGPLRLLCVARLVRRKGLDDLFHAMALLRDEPIHLTLQGIGSQQDELARLAISLGVADRISFAGFKDRDSLPVVYQKADLFVMPSLAESFGLATLEAMACGLPVVVSRVGGMVEYVKDGENGLIVPPRDPEALANAIRSLARNPGLRRSMGARNAQKVRQEYTWQHVADAYLQIYQQVRHDP